MCIPFDKNYGTFLVDCPCIQEFERKIAEGVIPSPALTGYVSLALSSSGAGLIPNKYYDENAGVDEARRLADSNLAASHQQII